jgi:hypothetical protein
MRKGGGKSKGAAFEREVCVLLSRWVTAGKRDDCYWRSAMSGGRSTVARRKGVSLATQAGDISCIHPDGHRLTNKFYIECKHYKDLNFLGLLKGTGYLVEFWLETKQQAQRYQKLPMLIAKQNLLPTMICLSTEGASQLQVSKRALLIAPKQNLRIMPFYEFFRCAFAP